MRFPASLLHRGIACRFVVGLALTAAIWPVPVVAQEQVVAGRRALLTLSVNRVEQPEVLVIIRDADLLVPVSALDAAGMTKFQGRRETIDAQSWVSLASLAPGVRYEFDERGLALTITAAPEYFSRATVNLRAPRPQMEYLRATSAFLNYGATWTQAAGTTGAFETGFSFGSAVATNTFSYDRSQGWMRGLTNLTIDRPNQMQRWRLGDSALSARSLSSGLVLAGLHVSRDTSLDPYFVQFPTMALSGTALTPSTVDVYVNDRLVSRQQVAPGTFDLSNVPMNAGGNNTRVIVRDAFGREQQIAGAFYLTSSALARGVHDYDYAVGTPRGANAATRWDYGALSATARHRYGLTDTLTVGVAAEGNGHRGAAGPSLNLRLPFAEVELAAQGSRSAGRTGSAVLFGLSSVHRVLSLSASLRAMSRDYSTLTIAAPRDRSRLQLSTQAASYLGHGIGVSVQEQYANTYDGQVIARTGVSASMQLLSRASLFLTATRAREGGSLGYEIFAGITVAAGNRTSASAWAQRHNGRFTPMAEVQRALPIGTALGYRVRADQGSNLAQGELNYQGPYGRYDVSEEMLNDHPSARLNVTGGLVAIGGGVHPSREVSDSYALVRVPNVGGVRAFANNQEVGRTSRQGDILVPNLLPYYANRLSIADTDIPLDHAITSVERVVAPPFRGGSVVVFTATPISSVTGTVVLDFGGQSVLPVLGQLSLSVRGTTVDSPIGRKGEFYFESLEPGTYSAVVQFETTTCRFQLDVPAGRTFTSLGVVRCAVKQ